MLLRLQAWANVFIFLALAPLFYGSAAFLWMLAFSGLFAISGTLLVWRNYKLPLLGTWLAAIVAFIIGTRHLDWGFMDGGTPLAIAALYLLAGLIGAVLMMPFSKAAGAEPAHAKPADGG